MPCPEKRQSDMNYGDETPGIEAGVLQIPHYLSIESIPSNKSTTLTRSVWVWF